MKQTNLRGLTLWILVFLIPATLAAPAFSQEEMTLCLDIKPDSCVNPLNITSYGTLTMAILGNEDYDVSNIDLGSRLVPGEITPIRVFYEDVGAPPANGSFVCGNCPDPTPRWDYGSSPAIRYGGGCGNGRQPAGDRVG